MTRVALVRHGRTAWNVERRYQGRRGVGLDAVGRAQARGAAATLSPAAAGWRWLASSGAARAAQTAEILGTLLGLACDERVPELGERGFGVADGMLIAEAHARWPDGDFPGLEREAAVVERALAGLDGLVARHAGADGVVVTHGVLIRLTVGALLGAPAEHVANGSVAVLAGEPGAWRVVPSPSETRAPGRRSLP